MRTALLALVAASALSVPGCTPAESTDPDVDVIDASDYFPLAEGRMWQFQVEGAGDELGFTFLRVGEPETLAGVQVHPVTISAGTEESGAVVQAILLLSSANGWVTLAGLRDPETGEDQPFSTPAALGRPQWPAGDVVSTDLEAGGQAQSWAATLEEIADFQVYYGTFFDSAHVAISAGEGVASPVAGTWWWGHAVGPIHFVPAAEDSFALELVYYE